MNVKNAEIIPLVIVVISAIEYMLFQENGTDGKNYIIQFLVAHVNIVLLVKKDCKKLEIIRINLTETEYHKKKVAILYKELTVLNISFQHSFFFSHQPLG